MKHFLFIVFFLLIITRDIIAAPIEVIVTPADPQGWTVENDRADSSVSISTNQPRAGNGSLEFITNFVTPGQDKVDYQLAWDPVVFTDRTLDNLSNLSFEYYRDSAGSTVAGQFHPVLRLGWYNDAGTPVDITDDTNGFLIYEEIYQGVNPVPIDAWDTNIINFATSNLWIFCSACTGGASGVVQNFNSTLNDWRTGPITGLGGDPVPPDLSLGTTYVFAVSTGVGSGWNNDVLMWVDNINIAFGMGDDFIYNFEVASSLAPTAVPLFNNFGSLLMTLSILLAGFYFRRVS